MPQRNTALQPSAATSASHVPASDAVSSRTPNAWPWPPLLKGTVALHAAAAVTAAARPEWWPAVLAAMVANHALLTGEVLRPRGSLLGPNVTRLPDAAAARGQVSLTIDDGPEPAVTPAVLDLLDRHHMQATFFCIGTRVLQHPELAREILRRGHTIGNHSQVHRHDFSFQGPKGYEREVLAAQHAIEQTTGVSPRFFRAPAGFRNLFLDRVLHRHGLTLVSWTRRGFDTRERSPERVLGRLCRDLRGGDILLLHDGHAARTDEGQPVVLPVLAQLLDRLQAAGLASVPLEAALPTRHAHTHD